MKTIIAGSRSIQDYALVERAVHDAGWVISEVVSGAAAGVDRLGERWAARHGVPVRSFPANWAMGRMAGMLRNIEMARYAEALVLVWDGSSAGSRQMLKVARSKGLRVHVLVVGSNQEGPAGWVQASFT